MQTQIQHIPIGHPNRPGDKLESLQALVFHYTNNEDPDATDIMNARYFGRRWETGSYWDDKNAIARTGPIEYASFGHGARKLGIPFGYGSAQITVDIDSVTEAIPTDEAAWGCGDRRLPFDNGFKGQQPIAQTLFAGRQNWRTINIELCNNDTIPDSDADWWGACGNAANWAVDFLINNRLTVNVEKSLYPQTVTSLEKGEILLLRHHDITGKICPAPFVGEAQHEWVKYVVDIASRVAGMITI